MSRDRQEAPSLGGIAPGHLYRYVFAKPMAHGDVLDCACGVGYGAYVLAVDRDDITVTAVDISADALDYARRFYGSGNIQWVLGNALDRPWGGQKFDLICCFETLEHLSEPKRLLGHFKNSLKPDGKLIASVPNEAAYPFDPQAFEGEEYPHRRHYTPDQFMDLMEKTGFRVIHRGTQLKKQSTVVNGTAGKFLTYTCEPYQSVELAA